MDPGSRTVDGGVCPRSGGSSRELRLEVLSDTEEASAMPDASPSCSMRPFGFGTFFLLVFFFLPMPSSPLFA